VLDPEEAADAEEPLEADAQSAPKKKRTRRGTRGGRGRKKPAPAGASTDDAEPAGAENGRPSPKIHVPPPDLAGPVPEDESSPEPVEAASDDAAAETADSETDGAPKRKRSRRGSRGGRKRKKPAVNGDEATEPTEATANPGEAAEAAQPTEETADPDEAPSDNGAPEYVPMSEWIDDFEARRR
jgi:hypothetical protein